MCESRGCQWGRQKAGGRFGTSGPHQRPGKGAGSGGGTCLGIGIQLKERFKVYARGHGV